MNLSGTTLKLARRPVPRRRPDCDAGEPLRTDLPYTRLGRALESLEAALVAAERLAITCRDSIAGRQTAGPGDIDSRREELVDRERRLQDRERLLEQRRIQLDLCQAQLARAKDGLKRALTRFQSQMELKETGMKERQLRLDYDRQALIDERRAFAREQMQYKARLRQHV